MGDIAADDLRNQVEANLFRGTLLGHIFDPQRLVWGLCSREHSVYNFERENIWDGSLPESRFRDIAARPVDGRSDLTPPHGRKALLVALERKGLIAFIGGQPAPGRVSTI
jgi:hypothetical protein